MTDGPEKKFQDQVIAYLKSKGCYIINVAGGTSTHKGTPDLICSINGRFYAIEVKAERGRVSELQKYHLEQIRNSGGKAIVLKRSNFDIFKMEVEDILKQ